MDWYNMKYKFSNREMKPIQLVDGFISSIFIDQYVDAFTNKWVLNITFIGYDNQRKSWKFLMMFEVSEHFDFIIDSVLIYLEQSRDKFTKLFIYSFKQQMRQQEISLKLKGALNYGI